MNKIEMWSVLGLSAVVALAAADTPPPVPTPAAAAAHAAALTPSVEARIPFANHGGIYNWQVVDSRTILIQGRDRKWYRATLFSSCIDLPFSERLGFKSNADGSFDKFSSIHVRRQNCPLTSLVETAAPLKKARAEKSGDAAGAAPTNGMRSAAPESPTSPPPQ